MLRSRLPAASRQSRRTLPELPAQRPATPDLSPSPADLLFNTWPGRLFLVAAALKLLVAVLRRVTGVPGAMSCQPHRDDRADGRGWLFRLAALPADEAPAAVVRAPQAIPSYIFIGVWPAPPIIAFFTLGAFVISTNVSAYLFRDGYDDMVNYAGLAANAAASEVGRAPAAAGETMARVQRNASNAGPLHLRLSIVFVPNAEGAPPLVRAGEWGHAAGPNSIPVWLTAVPGAFVGTVAPATV